MASAIVFLQEIVVANYPVNTECFLVSEPVVGAFDELSPIFQQCYVPFYRWGN